MASRQLNRLLCLLVLQVVPVQADEAMPSIELLEFLAEMDNTSGEWVDPLHMKEIAKNDEIEEPTQVKDDE